VNVAVATAKGAPAAEVNPVAVIVSPIVMVVAASPMVTVRTVLVAFQTAVVNGPQILATGNGASAAVMLGTVATTIGVIGIENVKIKVSPTTVGKPSLLPVVVHATVGGIAVAGNTAVTTPELIGLVSVVDPATVNKFAATPVKVNPVFGVSVIVAVYTVPAANVPPATTVGDHVVTPVY